MDAQKRGNPSLLGTPGIAGTGASVDDAGNPVVVVFVSDSNLADVPETIDGVRVTVEVTGILQPLQGKPDAVGPMKDAPRRHDPKPIVSSDWTTTCYVGERTAKTPRPVPIGVSVGTAGFSGGTYGARLRDAQGNRFMLSNNHVFAGRNSAPLGAKALQPRPQDGGISLTDSVGTLVDFEPLVFFEATFEGALNPASIPVNIMDAAVVATSPELASNSTPCDGYGIPSSISVAPYNVPVKKYGRTTGLTTGNINAFNVTVDILFAVLPNGNWKMARFVNQIIIRKPGFCNGGDSGSLVVTEGGNPVGMIFAGSPASSSLCVANPILPVLSRFGMTVDGY